MVTRETGPEIPAAPADHLAFYGLREAPFRAGADAQALWLGRAHVALLDRLTSGVRRSGAVAVLTGESGTGKTSLANRVAEAARAAGARVGRVADPGRDAADLFQAVLGAFGIRTEPRTRQAFAAAMGEVMTRPAAAGGVLLVVDEAQSLGAAALRELLELSAAAEAQRDPLTMLLVGQPELLGMLAEPQNLALGRRVTERCAVAPLSRDETAAYLGHCVERAGGLGAIWEPAAIDAITSLSRGAPGAINIIGDRSLLIGAARRARRVTAEIVEESCRHPGSPTRTSSRARGVKRPAPRLGPASARHARPSRRGVKVGLALASASLLVIAAPPLARWLSGLAQDSEDRAAPRVSAPADRPAGDSGRPAATAVVETSRPDPAPEVTLPPAVPRALAGHAVAADAQPPAAQPDLAVRPGRLQTKEMPRREAPARPAVEATAPRAITAPAVRTAEPRALAPAPSLAAPAPTSLPAAPAPPAPPAAAAATTAPASPPDPARASAQPRTEGPDPGAVIDWLMKESPGRR